MRRSRSRRAAAPRGFFGNPRLFCAPTSILRRSLTPNRPSSWWPATGLGASLPTSPSVQAAGRCRDL